jgi:hypothetical protein
MSTTELESDRSAEQLQFRGGRAASAVPIALFIV